MAKTKSTKEIQTQFDQRRIEIYKQDSEYYRHQEKLSWGRFQTAVIIEGALLITRFSESSMSTLKSAPPVLGGQIFLLILITGAAILTQILFSISLKDHVEADRHMTRIRLFENDNPHPVHTHFVFSRSHLMFVAMIAIAIINVVVIISLRPLSFFAG